MHFAPCCFIVIRTKTKQIIGRIPCYGMAGDKGRSNLNLESQRSQNCTEHLKASDHNRAPPNGVRGLLFIYWWPILSISR